MITPFGTYLFFKMPFGLRNAGSTFQRVIDSVLAGVPNVFIYMDDILCFSRTIEEHEESVCLVLQCLQDAGLVFNPEKSKFFCSTIDFLGHNVLDSGVRPLK